MAILLVGLSLSSISTVFADDAVSISAGNAECKPGETVKIPVALDKNSGLGGIDIRFRYDTDVFDLTAENGDIFDTFGGKKNFTIYSSDGENTDKTGVLMTLTITVKTDAKPGEYTIEPIVNSATKKVGSGESTKVQNIECAVSGGIITIEGGHTHTSVIIPGKAATCTEEGMTDGEKCSECGEILKKQEIIPAAGHKWDEGKVTKAPTCTGEGVKQFTCTVCDEKKTESVESLGHDWAADFTIDKEPTAAAPGEKSIHCSRCDARKDITEIPIADESVAIAVGNAESKPGETIEIPVVLQKNTGLGGIDIRFKYDTDAFVITGKNGEIFDTFGGKKNYTIYNSDGENTEKTGTLLTLTITVKEDAKPGEYTIEPIVNSATAKEGAGENTAVKNVLCSVSNGTITVKDEPISPGKEQLRAELVGSDSTPAAREALELKRFSKPNPNGTEPYRYLSDDPTGCYTAVFTDLDGDGSEELIRICVVPIEDNILEMSYYGVVVMADEKNSATGKVTHTEWNDREFGTLHLLTADEGFECSFIAIDEEEKNITLVHRFLYDFYSYRYITLSYANGSFEKTIDQKIYLDISPDSNGKLTGANAELEGKLLYPVRDGRLVDEAELEEQSAFIFGYSKGSDHADVDFVIRDRLESYKMLTGYGYPQYQPTILYGDVYKDGIIDGRDATFLLQYLNEWKVEINEEAADCNPDGEIDGSDATRLLQYLAEWDVTLGK